MKRNILNETENILLSAKRLKNISMKSKLLIFLTIGICSVLVIYGSTAYIARNSMLDQSKDSILNLSAQLLNNLDHKVRGIETASYQMKEVLEDKGLNIPDKSADSNLYNEARQNFQDILISSESVYPYITAAVYENPEGVSYYYEKAGNTGKDSRPAITSEDRKLLSAGRPYIWKNIDDQEIFLRLIVDENTLEEKGCLKFFMSPDFFALIEMENPVLSNENLVILDSDHTVQNVTGFDTQEEEIRSLISMPDTGMSNVQEVHCQGDKYLAFQSDSPRTGWRSLILVSVEQILKQQNTFMEVSLFVVFVIIVFLFITSVWIMKGITSNIRILMEGMERFEDEGKALRIKPYNYDEVGRLITRFNYMTVHIEELNQNIQRERSKKEKAEFLAMQARINPHFLYNTLGSIKWVAHREQQEYIEKMIDSLIYLMRFSIKKTDTFLTAEEELTYIRHYLKLQEMRFGKVYTVDIEADEEARQAKMTGFILQPLVENALYHGIDMESGTGVIEIKVIRTGDTLRMSVKDNGNGMTAEQKDRIMEEEKEYKGFNSVGMQITATRLQAFYPSCHSFQIESEPGKGTEIIIEIPYERWKHVPDINC